MYAIVLAASRETKSVVDGLIKRKADLDTKRRFLGHTALGATEYKGDIDTVMALLGDVNIRGRYRGSALVAAC